MEILPKSVVMNLKGKKRKGLVLEDMEKSIADLCNIFGNTKINPSHRPSLSFPPEIIGGVDIIKSLATGFPKPYRPSSELNLAGLNLGKIESIRGKKVKEDLYVIATILAEIYRVPRNYDENITLEDKLAKNDELRGYLDNRAIKRENGFILERYLKLQKDKIGGVIERILVPSDEGIRGIYPIVRELHILSPNKRAIYDFEEKNISNGVSGYIDIRPNKVYPGKILEGLRLFIKDHEAIKNSPLSILQENENYHEIEIKLKKYYSE